MLRSGGGSLRYRRHTRRMIRSGWRPSGRLIERMRHGGRHTLRRSGLN
jgi:hypothetical protein